MVIVYRYLYQNGGEIFSIRFYDRVCRECYKNIDRG